MTGVQKYIDSLPNDITSIDLSNRNLSKLPDLSRFKNLLTLNCSFNQLTYLPELNEKIKRLN